MKCLIVLGMHRSGTSATMGVLKNLGVETGSNFMEPRVWNPKGNFELLNLYEINERILSRLDSSWDSPCLLPENWWDDGFDEIKKDSINLLKNFDAEIIGMKDPRLCRVLPVWKEAIRSAGAKPYFVIPLRHPLETAASLNARNKFSQEKSLLLWMLYMLDAEYYSRNLPRVFIMYEDLFKNISSVVDRISAELDIKFPRSFEEARGDIERFLDRGLKHHNEDSEPKGQPLFEEIFGFYRLLSQFASGAPVSGEALSEIDRIRDRHFALNRMFYNRDIKEAIAAKAFAADKNEPDRPGKKNITWPKKFERYFRKAVVLPVKEKFSARREAEIENGGR